MKNEFLVGIKTGKKSLVGIKMKKENKSGIVFKFPSGDYEPTNKELGIKKMKKEFNLSEKRKEMFEAVIGFISLTSIFILSCAF